MVNLELETLKIENDKLRAEIEALKFGLDLKNDEYVQQVGKWKIYQRLDEQVDNLRRQVSIYEKALENITAPYKDIGLGCYHEEIARAALEEGRK